MGLPHCVAGEVMNLVQPKEEFPADKSIALVKTEAIEVIRMVLPKGKEIPTHSVPGEITVQCISGLLSFFVEGEAREMQRADWLYLSANQEHALAAKEDSVLLVTIILR